MTYEEFFVDPCNLRNILSDLYQLTFHFTKHSKKNTARMLLTDFCLSEALIGIIGGKNDGDEYETPVYRAFPFID